MHFVPILSLSLILGLRFVLPSKCSPKWKEVERVRGASSKKGGREFSSHPKCLHIGIILIVYVIQKVVQKYSFFLKYANLLANNFVICVFLCNFASTNLVNRAFAAKK